MAMAAPAPEPPMTEWAPREPWMEATNQSQDGLPPSFWSLGGTAKAPPGVPWTPDNAVMPDGGVAGLSWTQPPPPTSAPEGFVGQEAWQGTLPTTDFMHMQMPPPMQPQIPSQMQNQFTMQQQQQCQWLPTPTPVWNPCQNQW